MSEQLPPIHAVEDSLLLTVNDELDEEAKDFLDFLQDDEDEEPTDAPSPMHLAAPPKQFVDDSHQATPPAEPILPSAQIEVLKHRLVETVTVVHNNGIETTTVDIGQGRFKGATVTITLTDTHPTSYKVELAGDAEAMMAFHQNLAHFQKGLEGVLPECQFAVTAVIAEKEYEQKKRTVVRKKQDRYG